MQLEGLGQLKISNDGIGNRTRDLPASSIVPLTNNAHKNKKGRNRIIMAYVLACRWPTCAGGTTYPSSQNSWTQ
jgi:hypothetical protein